VVELAEKLHMANGQRPKPYLAELKAVYLVLMSFAENLAGHTVYTKTYRLIEKWK
jgi:hypothetical protein